MKLRTFSIAAVALLAVGVALAGFSPDVAAAAWHFVQASALTPEGLLLASAPTVLARSIASAYERKGEGDDDAPGIVEIKGLLEKQGQAWAEFKRTNDELLKAKADGKAVGDLEAKLSKVSADLDQLAEIKSQFDALMAKMQRPNLGEAKAQEDAAVELKSFNAMRRSEAQVKGRATPADLTAEQYTQYKSAFFQFVRTGDKDSLSSDERKALSAGSDPDGGYLLPTPTVGRMVKRIFEKSLMRQLANVQTISTEALEGIVDNGEAGAGWVGETAARSDTTTPQVGKYRIEAHEMYAQPKATQKLIDDAAVDIEAWLAEKVGDKFARVESDAYWNGNGIAKPRGLATYTTVATGDDTRTWGQFEHVLSGTDGAFNNTTKGDVLFDLIGKFRSEYLQNAQWVMRREVRTAIRKLRGATSDQYLWEPSLQAGVPDKLLGYPANIDQYMPALAADSLSLGFGDFNEGYTIVDRIGVRTLRDPYTDKPYVKFYSTKRTGGAAVNFEAVKFLKFGD